MSLLISDCLEYLDIHPVNKLGDAFSVMDLVFHAYSMYNEMDSEDLQKFREKAFSILNTLPEVDAEKLMDAFEDWLVESEKVAFSHGIGVGMYLESELGMEP